MSMTTRWSVVAALAACLVALSPSAVVSRQPTGIAARLGDAEFWRLVDQLSEPNGYFEDENYVSNELGYERTMPRLQAAIPPGGVFLGVGPEQNFAYVAALQPAMAFVIDIRRQNLAQHLMYKALFDLAENRADFISRLFSRPRPADLDETSSVEALFEAYAAAAREPRRFEQNLAAILDNLTVGRGFALTDADRASIAKVYRAFYDNGPEIMYVFRGTAERHPTYAQMMTVRDDAARHWSFLGSSQAFESVRLMQQRNLIVPVVGDFAGPKALRAIGAYLRERNAAVSVFYVSNVEPYLFAAGSWRAFYENVAALPTHPDGLFVRAFFGSTARECAALRPTIRRPVLGSIAALMAAYREGRVKTQCDLVTASLR
jgi:hypothetical protein